jgi:hypothetical protein
MQVAKLARRADFLTPVRPRNPPQASYSLRPLAPGRDLEAVPPHKRSQMDHPMGGDPLSVY